MLLKKTASTAAVGGIFKKLKHQAHQWRTLKHIKTDPENFPKKKISKYALTITGNINITFDCCPCLLSCDFTLIFPSLLMQVLYFVFNVINNLLLVKPVKDHCWLYVQCYLMLINHLITFNCCHI